MKKRTVSIISAAILAFFSSLLGCPTLSAQKYMYDAEFTQVHTLKVSGRTKEMKGHILYDGKDQLSMIYSQPQGEFFIIDGPFVRMDLHGRQAELSADKLPQVKLQRATLLNCLSGNWEQAALDNNAVASVSEKGGLRTVSIVAEKVVARGGYKSVVLTYRLSDGILTRMVLEEITGIEDTYEIK